MTEADHTLLTHELRLSGCVFAEDEADVILSAAPDRLTMFAMLQQRLAGVPLEHIVGHVDFACIRLVVRDHVFVPRRRTEWLVAQALAVIEPAALVVDLCCGCGAVAAALLARRSDLRAVYAADIDRAAIDCAAENLAPYDNAEAYLGDLYSALPARIGGRVNVIVANAPYVPTAEIAMMPREARDHEPVIALDGGEDGLDVQRRLIEKAPHWLALHGHLLVETSRLQAESACRLMRAVGLAPTVLTDDELAATVVRGTLTRAQR